MLQHLQEVTVLNNSPIIALIFFIKATALLAKPSILENGYYKSAWNSSQNSASWTEHYFKDSELTVQRGGEVYRQDQRIPDSPTPNDYKRSGYDRGHLVPAGDMSFSELAIKSTFLMTNITPQKPELNRCAWLRLENSIRNWCQLNSNLKIKTGTLFLNEEQPKLIKQKIPIPDAFYKAVYCPIRNNAIAFIMPNGTANKTLPNYQVSLKYLEKITGTKIFPELSYSIKTKTHKWFRKPLIGFLNILIYIAGSVLYFHFRI